jgi:hypothetical protein
MELLGVFKRQAARKCCRFQRCLAALSSTRTCGK